MVKFFNLRLIIFLIFVSFSRVFGQILFAEISDSHSNYDNMLKFLKDLSGRVEEFRSAHPLGQVVLLVNGDFGGASGLASAIVEGHSDEGAIGHKTLVDLSNAGIKVIFNTGNHDGHDFAKRYQDNHVFKKEMGVLHSSGNNIALLGTNIDFTPVSGLAPLFLKHYDIKDSAAGTTRVFGLTLEDIYSKSSVVINVDPIFSHIHSYEVALRAQLNQAISSGNVDQVLIMIHDSTPLVQALANRIEAEFAGRISFAGWIAGHDHVQANKLTNRGTPIINGGSQFENVISQLNASGKLSEIQITESKNLGTFPTKELNSELAKKIAEIANKSAVGVQEIKTAMQRNVYGYTENLIHGKIELKRGPRIPLGVALGNASRNWAQDSFGGPLKGRMVVGIFNTSSYRIDRGFAGPVAINDLLLSEIYPFEGVAKILELSGRQFFEVIRHLVWYQENQTAVQLSDNVRVFLKPEKKVKENGTSDSVLVPEVVEIKNAAGQWKPLRNNDQLLVGVDSWTGENGFKIDYSKNIYGRLVNELRPLKEVMTQNFRSNLKPGAVDSTLAVFQNYLADELITMPREIDRQLLPKPMMIYTCQKFYEAGN